MDTRRSSELIDAPDGRANTAPVAEVEIVELTAIARPKRGYLPHLAFVVGVAVLAGLIAIAGFPTRTSLAFDEPLPNFFAATPAP
jgi:hypothetical protein